MKFSFRFLLVAFVGLSGAALISAGPLFNAVQGDRARQAGPVRRSTASWAKWAESPTSLSLGLKVTAKAASNTIVLITLGDLTLQSTGLTCTASTNLPHSFARLQPYRLNVLSVTGEMTSSVSFEIIPPKPLNLDLTEAAEEGAPLPERYKVFINGIETNHISGINSNCAPYSTNWLIELRPDSDQRRQNGGRDDERELPDDTAPGDGSWLEMGPGKSSLTNEISMKWSATMGRLLNGKAAGRLRFMETSLTSNAYTPASLVFAKAFPLTNSSDPLRSQLTVLTNKLITNQSIIRQIIAPQAVADVRWDTNCFNGYEIHFYPTSALGSFVATSNFYEILTNTPFVIWRFTNSSPNPSNYTHLRVEEIRPSVSFTNEISYDVTNRCWTLTRGIGSEQRIERRYITFNGVDRFETNIVASFSGTTLYRAVEQYSPFEWGWELSSVLTDTGSTTHTQTFAYYTNATHTNTFGKLKWTTYPDGFWEKRLYHDGVTNSRFATWDQVDLLVNGELAYVLSPWNNAPTDPTNATWANSAGLQYYYGYDEYGYAPYVLIAHRSTNSISMGEYLQESTFTGFVDVSTIKIARRGAECHEGSAAEHGETRFVDWGSSLTCGHVRHQVSRYRLSTTNEFAYGLYTNGTFTAGPTNAWRQTSTTGSGRMNWSPVGCEDAHYTLPGKSTRTYLIRTQGCPVQRELQVAVLESGATNFYSLYTEYLSNDLLGHSTNIVRFDAVTGATRVMRTRDWQGTNAQPLNLLLSETDEDGRTTRYTYDSLKRIKSVEMTGVTSGAFPTQASVTVTFYYDAMNRSLRVETNAGTLFLANGFAYDLTGRIIAQTNEAGLVTTYSYSNGGRVTQVTLPSGATSTTSNYLSRKVESVTGTAIVNEYHEYHGNSASLCDQTSEPTYSETVTFGSASSGRLRRDVRNYWGWPVQEVTPGPVVPLTNLFHYGSETVNCSGGGSYFEVFDKLEMIQRPNPYGAYTGNNEFFTYDELRNQREHWFSGPDGTSGTAGSPSSTSSHKLTRTDVTYDCSTNGCFEVTTNTVYATNSSSVPTIVGITRMRVSGFPSGIKSEKITTDLDGRTDVEKTAVDRDARTVIVTLSSSASSLVATQVSVNGLLQTLSSLSVPAVTSYSYDALRRPTATVNTLGATATTVYDATTGRVTSSTDFAGNTTQIQYYGNGETGAGQPKCVTRADGKKTYYSYSSRGELARTWGNVPYPEERVYNDFGELTELRTYRGGSDWSGASWPASPGTADTTTWSYQTTSGLLLSKTDAAGKYVSYSYWNNGLLKSIGLSRTNEWELWDEDSWDVVTRVPVLTAYFYTNNGALVQVRFTNAVFIHSNANIIVTNYAAGPTFLTNYTRTGLPGKITDESSQRLLIYDPAQRLVAEIWASGVLADTMVSNRFTAHGRDLMQVTRSGTTLNTATFGFDSYGRLSTVTSGLATVSYTYQTGLDRLATTTSKHNGSTVLTATRQWDTAERLKSIQNTAGAAAFTSHNYIYDAVHRRTRAVREDGSTWKYGYDDRDQVTSGKHVWADNSPVTGQQFTYAYDNIGNRTSARNGGDVGGGSLRTTTYTANSLNQYTGVTTPGYEDILGVAIVTNTVTVDSGGCDRKGEYFHREIGVANGSSPLWQTTTVSCGGSSSNGGFVFPKNSQSLTYDEDGNLMFDGIWLYRWDTQNRLVEMVMTNGIVGIPTNYAKRLQFTNDFNGRRISKTVTTWNGSATTTGFVYDGWNLVAELDSSGNSVRTYTWGQDVSGTADGAGGIGGLLLVRDVGTTTNHFAAFDGNGNVTGLVAQNGADSARYEYGPFGEVIQATGFYASANPIRWSTKFTDAESSLNYYGFRYYSAVLGRWVSRDPIEEHGGANLCAFVFNNGINLVDPLGENIWQKFASRWNALFTTVILAGNLSTSDPKLTGQTPIQQSRSIQGRLRETERVMRSAASRQKSSGAGASGGRPGPTPHGGGGVLFAAALLVSVADGTAAEDASALVADLVSFARNRRNGDDAWADLDAAMIAVDVSLLTGDNTTALIVWDQLQDD